jgi:hypothetical protein
VIRFGRWNIVVPDTNIRFLVRLGKAVSPSRPDHRQDTAGGRGQGVATGQPRSGAKRP